MPSLRRMLKSLKHSPAEISKFNLDSAPHVDSLMKILKLARTPQVTIHFEVLYEEPQRLTLYCPAEDESHRDISLSPSNTSESIYAIASYTKVLINAAFARLLCDDSYRHLGLSWQTPACDLFNGLRRSKGKSTIERLWGHPELRQLLSHFNGFAPMNRYLIAPDGTFLMSEEEFIQDGPRITENRYRNEYPDRGWQEYSNGNHIFAGMILEEVTGRGLHEALQELLFGCLDLTHTIVSETALETSTVNTSAVVGYHITSKRHKAFPVPKKYLLDAVEAAALGARSSTEDLAKLNRSFLESIGNKPGTMFSRATMTEFFRPDHKMSGGGAVTLGGLFTALDSNVPGEESLNHIFRKSNGIPSYRVGRRPDGSSCNVYYKGGSVDGFASSVYLLLNDRSFIIVLGNSSGPLDPTDHIARYILQEAFQLQPRVDIVEYAEREFRSSSAYVDRIADEDTSVATTTLSVDVRDLAGQYKHSRYTQQLTITPEGSITIHGKQKTSSAMKLVYTGTDRVRILEDATPFGSERWFVWEDLEFVVHQNANGSTELIGNRGQDCFRRI